VIAWFSWKFVEMPFRSKTKVSRRSIFKFALIFTLFFSVTGLWLHNNNGALEYYPKEKQKILANFINPSDYVNKRHKQIRLLEFSKSNDKKDILIIGDSHSEDLVNAVFEAGLNNDMEFSSYYISVACGVLFVRDKKDREATNLHCQRKDGSFFDNDLQIQMSLADEIWIISSWTQRDLIYMSKSIENIKTINKNIKLFGTKNFGNPSSKWYNKVDIDDWSSAIFDDSDKSKYVTISKVNNDLSSISKSLSVEFFNTQHLICRGKAFCSNYIDGNIISYDGTHLTKHGAKILGFSLKDVLNKNNRLKD
jgi:hypothetical protein